MLKKSWKSKACPKNITFDINSEKIKWRRQYCGTAEKKNGEHISASKINLGCFWSPFPSPRPRNEQKEKYANFKRTLILKIVWLFGGTSENWIAKYCVSTKKGNDKWTKVIFAGNYMYKQQQKQRPVISKIEFIVFYLLTPIRKAVLTV